MRYAIHFSAVTIQLYYVITISLVMSRILEMIFLQSNPKLKSFIPKYQVYLHLSVTLITEF